MAISYIHPATNEPVSRERWRWVVEYIDGSQLQQFEVHQGQAIFHPFADIDQARVRKFTLEHDTLRPVHLYLPEGAKLVHAYVNGVYNVPLHDGDNSAIIQERGYKVGYQLDGKSYGILVGPDDSIRLLHDFDILLDADGKYDNLV